MKHLLFVISLIVLCIPSVALCQTDEEIFEEFRFNFATPGARASAMGRAFIGLADDATAAQSNPAGLVILTEPEVSFEYKNTSPVVERGAASDSLFTNEVTDFGESVDSASFVSFMYPKGRFRIAVFRQEFLNYQESFQLEARRIPDTNFSFFPVSANVDFRGTNLGVAVAYRFSPKFFGGFSAKASKLDVQTRSVRFNNCIDPDDNSCLQVNATEINESPSEFGFTGGVLINPNLKFSLGLIYEYNPKFDYQEDFDGLVNDRTFDVTIDVPDRFGAGVAIRASDTLVFLADVVFVRYSELSDSFTVIIAADSDVATADDFVIENGTEFHAGAEKTFFAGTTQIAIRGGVFSNPAHDLRYRGGRGGLDGITADELFNFNQAETEVGFTFGGGAVIAERFQIDAAYLVSDPFDEFSASFVIRF